MDGDGDRITRDSPFLIGSVAKTMTATLVMQLEARGRLELEGHVSDHLVTLPGADPTVEQLLTHTAGFTAADGIAVADRHDNDPGAVQRAVQELRHSGSVGEYAYSSAGYLVLGGIVEQVTGRPYAEVLQTELLEPLGMSSSQATAGGARTLAPGHRHWWGRAVRYAPDFDESGGPYGSVTSTLDDLTAYAAAQLGGELLPEPLRTEMQRPHVASSRDHYGLGWSVTQVGDDRVVHHTGANPGYFAHILLVPDHQVAVVILANAYSEARAPSLAAGAQDVWRILEGRPRTPARGDTLTTVLPWALLGVAVLGLASVAWSRRRPARRWPRLTAAGCALVLAVALWSLPGLLGHDLRALRIWTPDAGWTLIAAAGAWVLAAALLLAPPRGGGHRSR